MWFRTFLFIAAFLFGLSLVMVIGSYLREDRPHPDGPAPRERLSPLWEAPEFELTSTNGDRLTHADLRDRVWMANFIFSRCPGPCPLMTARMRELQVALEEAPVSPEEIAFVSFSVDPDYDTPEVLAEYAEGWKADLSNWFFLTGEPLEEVKRIARDFRLGVELSEDGRGAHGVPDSDEEIPPVLHSTRFVLVDRTGRVREVYDSEAPGFAETAVGDILTLLRER